MLLPEGKDQQRPKLEPLSSGFACFFGHKSGQDLFMKQARFSESPRAKQVAGHSPQIRFEQAPDRNEEPDFGSVEHSLRNQPFNSLAKDIFLAIAFSCLAQL